MATPVTTRSAGVQIFFDDLAARPSQPLLHQISGTIEWNIQDAGRWWLTINRGIIRVSQSPHQAECIASCTAETFMAIVGGQQNLAAAGLRGAVKVSGDLALGLSFQRLLP
jgi:predicted lipid carrier protein YhbT